MQLRHFDPDQEQLAAEWARVALVSPDGWVNQYGQNLEARAIDFLTGDVRDHHRQRLGFFTRDGVEAYAKIRPPYRPFAKIVSDLAYETKLPAAPEAIAKVTAGDRDVFVTLSMAPFIEHGLMYAGLNAHPITTVAMVLGTWVHHQSMQKHDDVCFALDAGLHGDNARGALFDFDRALIGLSRGADQATFRLPDYARPSDIRRDVAYEVMGRIRAVPDSVIADIVSRNDDRLLPPALKEDMIDYLIAMRDGHLARTVENFFARYTK